MLNKIDLLPEEEVGKVYDDIIKRLDWKGPAFAVSGIAKQGLDDLAKKAMKYLDDEKE